jgi:hypothetical protein
MTRDSGRDRAILGACAGAAVAIALANAVAFQWMHNNWVGTAMSALPACLALAAVVLTARAPAATVIGVVAGIVGVVANLAFFDIDGSLVPFVDGYLRWVLWAAVVGCSLLVADAMAWRRGRFSAASGAVAGLLVGVVAGVAKLALDLVGPGDLPFHDLPWGYWVQVYVVPTLMLVAAGAVTGAVALRQETAGVA